MKKITTNFSVTIKSFKIAVCKHCRLYRMNLGISRALIFMYQGKQRGSLVQALSFTYDVVVRRIERHSSSMVNAVLHQVLMNQRFWL